MRFQGRVTIDRSVREVFEFVSLPEHLHLWASGVAGAERTCPGPVGVGATFELLGEGKAHRECWEVIEHEPPRAFAYRGLDCGAFTQCRYTLQNIDGCTGLGLEMYSGMGTSSVSGRLLQQEAERQLAAQLGRLREVLENGLSQEGMTDGDDVVVARGLAAGRGVQPLGARGHHARPAAPQAVTAVRGTRAREPG